MNRTTRRRILEGIAASLPAFWMTPIVETVVLPAHAQSSPPDDDSCQCDAITIEEFSGSVLNDVATMSSNGTVASTPAGCLNGQTVEWRMTANSTACDVAAGEDFASTSGTAVIINGAWSFDDEAVGIGEDSIGSVTLTVRLQGCDDAVECLDEF